jgi:hypothetical protein
MKMGRAEIIGGAAELGIIFAEEVASHRKRIAKDSLETRGEMLVMGKKIRNLYIIHLF